MMTIKGWPGVDEGFEVITNESEINVKSRVINAEHQANQITNLAEQ